MIIVLSLISELNWNLDWMVWFCGIVIQKSPDPTSLRTFNSGVIWSDWRILRNSQEVCTSATNFKWSLNIPPKSLMRFYTYSHKYLHLCIHHPEQHINHIQCIAPQYRRLLALLTLGFSYSQIIENMKNMIRAIKF